MKKLIVVPGGPGISSDYVIHPFRDHLNECFEIIPFDYHLLHPTSFDLVTSRFDQFLSKFNHEQINIFAHSFGSMIVLAHFRKTQKTFARYIFSNWIYDYAWTESFLELNKQYLDQNYKESNSLKERMLSLVDLYFDDTATGYSVLNRQTYNDKCFDILNSEGKKLSFENEVMHLSSKILSIASLNDKIIYPFYIAEIVRKHNLNSMFLSSGAHFPFVSSQSMFYEKLKLQF